MSGTRITMTGADSQQYQSAVGLQSRLIQFPDMARHFTLSNWEWEVFDNYPYKDDLADAVYSHTLKFWLFDEFAAASTGLDVPEPPPATPDRGHASRASRTPRGRVFEARLRRAFQQMILINMPQASGFAEDPSNQF